MTTKTFLQASIFSAVVMWVLAGIAHEVIFVNFFSDASHASHKGPALIFVAYCILSFIMTYLFSVCVKRDKLIVAGIKFGALIGVLWVFPHGLAMAAAHGESIVHEILNGIWHVLEQAVGGMAIAYIINRQLKRAQVKN